MSIYPPYIIERSSRGEKTYDIFSRLLMDRIVFLGSGINDDVANIILAQLLFLDAEDPELNLRGKTRARALLEREELTSAEREPLLRATELSRAARRLALMAPPAPAKASAPSSIGVFW